MFYGTLHVRAPSYLACGIEEYRGPYTYREGRESWVVDGGMPVDHAKALIREHCPEVEHDLNYFVAENDVEIPCTVKTEMKWGSAVNKDDARVRRHLFKVDFYVDLTTTDPTA